MRSPTTMIRIAGPFGGLNTNTASRLLSPRDCIDNLNVHTRGGQIEKRPGRALFSNTLHGTSGFHILRSMRIGGALRLYLGVDTGSTTLHKLVASDDTSYSFSSGRDGQFSVANVQNRLYLATGDSALSRKVYQDGVDFVNHRIGIEPPSTAPILTLLSGPPGLIQGIYSYRYTFYNSRADVESSPSPAAERIVNLDNAFVRIVPSGSADGQVDRVKIYRRRSLLFPPGGAVDTTWYFVATAPIANYDDHNVTISNALADQLNLISSVPPPSNNICWHKRRMWWGVNTFMQDVRPSEIDRPETVNPLAGFRIVDRHYDSCTVMHSAFGALWFFNTDSIWVIAGDDLASFQPAQIVQDVGCIARYSLVAVEGSVFFVDRNGLFRFDGSNLELCSEAIDPTWRTFFDFSRAAEMSAAFEPLSRCYYLTGVNPAPPGHPEYGLINRGLAYQIDRKTWYVWDVPAGGMVTRRSSLTGSTPRRRLHFVVATGDASGANAGRVAVLQDDQFADQGIEGNIPIAWRWQTGHLDHGTSWRKHLLVAHANFEPGSAGDTLTLQLMPDFASLVPIGSTPMDRGHKPFVVGRMGRVLGFKASGSSSGVMKLSGVDLEAQVVGSF